MLFRLRRNPCVSLRLLRYALSLEFLSWKFPAYRNTSNVSACIFPFVLNKLFS